MRKIIVYVSCFIVSQSLFTQTTTNIWVFLKDKNTCKSSIQMNNVLSEKAIEKRKKYNIPFDERDIPVCNEYIQEIIKLGGFKVRSVSKWLNAVSLECTDTVNIKKLGQLSCVEKLQLIKNHNLPQKSTIDNQKFSQIYDSNEALYYPAEYGASYDQNNMIQIQSLHDMGFTGEGITIAVFDAGFLGVDTIRFFKPMFNEGRVLYSLNLVDSLKSVYNHSAHGTSVLSLMAGYTPGQYIGTAPKANYMLFVTEDVTKEVRKEEENWLRAIEIADSLGVDIINSSLGYSTFDDTSDNYTYENMDGNTALITRAADIAASKGILVVTSAGNEGSGSWRHITAPADADSVLTVGSVDALRNYSSYSSVGPTFDGRLKPNVSAQGQKPYYIQQNGQISNAGSGTSFASPIIAGASACLWQSAKNVTNMQVLDAIQKSAHQYMFPDHYMGFGIPNFNNAYYFLHPTDTLPILNDWYSVFPNPFQSNLYLRFFSVSEQEINISLLNTFFQEVYTYNWIVYKGFNEYTIPFEDNITINQGMYFLRIKTLNQEYVSKLIRTEIE